MRTKMLYLFGGLALFLYVASNVFASQTFFNPIMFRLVMMKDISATHEFLANLAGSPLYETQLRYFNSQFDNVFAQEIDTKQLNAEKALRHYESLLRVNPRGRDVLVELALLEKDLGNVESARTYYARAKDVDVWLKIPALETL